MEIPERSGVFGLVNKQGETEESRETQKKVAQAVRFAMMDLKTVTDALNVELTEEQLIIAEAALTLQKTDAFAGTPEKADHQAKVKAAMAAMRPSVSAEEVAA